MKTEKKPRQIQPKKIYFDIIGPEFEDVFKYYVLDSSLRLIY